MISIILIEIFYTKIVNTNREFGWTRFMFPKTWRVFAGMISVLLENINEVVVSQYCCLFEAIHTLLDANIDIVIIVYNVVDVVFVTYI